MKLTNVALFSSLMHQCVQDVSANGPNIIIMQPDDLVFFDEWGAPPGIPDQEKKDFPATNGLPNIERLRTQGLQMMEAYTASPKCGTSRYSTITGRYPSRSSYNRDKATTEAADIARVEIPTTKLADLDGHNDCTEDNMAATFLSNGYRTGMFGKWHLSRIIDSTYTYASSVDIVENCGFSTVGALYIENLQSDPNDFGNFADGTFSHNMEWLTYEAIEFIKSTDNTDNIDTPFFMYFNPTVPHSANNVGDALTEFTCRDTAAGTLDFDPVIKGMTQEYGSCTAYRDSVIARADNQNDYGAIWLDDSVGALLQALEDTNKLDNTIFLFQIDHGMDTKGALYEGGTRIPQFIYYPPIYAGTSFNGPVSTVDIAATMFDFAGITPSYGIDGSSWKDVIGDPEKEQLWKERCLFFENEKDRVARCGCDKYLTIYGQSNSESFTYSQGVRKGLSTDSVNLFNLCDTNGDYDLNTNQEISGNNLAAQETEKVTLISSVLQCHLDKTDYRVSPDYLTTCALEGNLTPAPTPAPQASTPAPTPEPTPPTDTCSDSTESFSAVKPGDNGWTKFKTCDGWVQRKSTAWRCKWVTGVKEACPKTCTNCCVETTENFTLLGNGKSKTCVWAAANPSVRCRKAPTRQVCAVTCGECE